MRAIWALVALLGCSLEPGEPCEATGEGFGRKDPCSTSCVEVEVPCADGSAVVPGICAGDACTDDAGCPEGWGCAAIDSFARSCLPQDTCPSGFAPAEGGG